MQNYIEINNKRYSIEHISNHANIIYNFIYNIVKVINDAIDYNRRLDIFVIDMLTKIVISRNTIKLSLISLFGKDYFIFKKEDLNIKYLTDILYSDKIDNYIEQYFQNNLSEIKDNSEFGYKVTDGWYSRFYKVLYEKKFKSMNLSLSEFFEIFLRSMFFVIIVYAYLEDFILDIFVRNNLDHLDADIRSKIVRLRDKISDFKTYLNYNKDELDIFVKEHWINIKNIIDNIKYNISIRDGEKIKNGFDELGNYISSISLSSILSITNRLRNKMNEISSLYSDIITVNINGNNINIVAIISETIQNILKNFYRY